MRCCPAPRVRIEPAANAALEEGPVRFRHVLGVCALTLAAVSCSLDTPLDAGAPEVLIELSDDQLTVGQESITITVTLRNVGYGSLTLTGPSDCLLFAEVLTPQGTPVWSSNTGCAGGSVTEEIASGETKTQSFSWAGTNTLGQGLAAGLYIVRGVARTTDRATIGLSLTVSLD
jgi:hypothetical protein